MTRLLYAITVIHIVDIIPFDVQLCRRIDVNAYVGRDSSTAAVVFTAIKYSVHVQRVREHVSGHVAIADWWPESNVR